MGSVEEISRGLVIGESCRAIGRRFGRAPSTISREIIANGGSGNYRACAAETSARRRARRPKVAKLLAYPRLRLTWRPTWRNAGHPSRFADWLPQASPKTERCRCPRDHVVLRSGPWCPAPRALTLPRWRTAQCRVTGKANAAGGHFSTTRRDVINWRREAIPSFL